MAKKIISCTNLNISKSKNYSKLSKDFYSAGAKLRQEISQQKIASIQAVYQDDELKLFAELAKLTKKFKKVLVLGVGGSSLGGKTICSLKEQNKLEFIESIDPHTLAKCLNKVNLEKTFFLVISKSGETIETICQTLIILDKFKEAKITNFAQQFLFVTQSLDNPIAKIAQKISAQIAHHPQNIGGRYSCFSIVGMLPAIIAGVDVKKIRLGAQKVLKNFLTQDEIIEESIALIDLYNQGFESNVIMPYIDDLKNFTDWYRQIWAESLGKAGFGSTPINSMGTVDQHSQLQLYLDGPKNKFFTFINNTNWLHDYKIKDLPQCPTLFGGKNLSQVLKIEHDTTIETLNQKKCPIRIFNLEKFDEESLGILMMRVFIETILVAYVKEINPFDQPAVEMRKDLARKLLQKK